MKTKKIIGLFLLVVTGSVLGVFVFTRITGSNEKIVTVKEVMPTSLTSLEERGATALDFTYAAEHTVEGVVHVKTQSVKYNYYSNPLYEFFYGERYKEAQPVLGFGSGVIISDDGYIVTNNHVIDNAQEIYVTLNDNHEYKAELIGADPTSDIALLKIEAENLTMIPYGDSDKLRLGEWVLAVGNPFNLTSTVTAGIVSAKGRSLGIIREQYRLESFIQTDAAVNQGNSGGALVNLKGELVGINTAIISPSGAYSGSSFAVPVNIVKKIVDDLIEYGEVQRAILGVTIEDVNAELAEEKGFDFFTGVYVSDISDNGAAKSAGIKKGDVIVSVNDIEVKTASELQEVIGRYRPNEKVTVIVMRDNKAKTFTVVLKNIQGTTQVVKANKKIESLGIKVEPVSKKDKKDLNIEHGVKITDVGPGKMKQEGVKPGFIIKRINYKNVDSVEDIQSVLENTEGGVYIEGVYPDGVVAYYAFGL